MSNLRTKMTSVIKHPLFPFVFVFLISLVLFLLVVCTSGRVTPKTTESKTAVVTETSTSTSSSITTHTTNTTTKTTTSTTSTQTTTESTSTTTTTTKTTITTTVQYIEPEVSDPIIYEEPEIVEEVYEPVQNEYGNTETYLGWYEGTWYTAVDMGYTSQPCGASGRYLETAYSVASNSIAQGSLIRVVGAGLDGVYRVDDRGGMANNVVDFYYWDRSYVPASFMNAGRVSIEVYLIE